MKRPDLPSRDTHVVSDGLARRLQARTAHVRGRIEVYVVAVVVRVVSAAAVPWGGGRGAAVASLIVPASPKKGSLVAGKPRNGAALLGKALRTLLSLKQRIA